MARTKEQRDIQPDLVLRIRHRKEGGNHHLSEVLEVRNRHLGLDLRDEEYPPVIIEGSLESFLPGYFRDVEELDPESDSERALAHRRLASLGVRLGEHLLPPELRRRLWSLRFKESAPSLLLLSNETWIPWEMIRLREDGGDGDQNEEALLGRYLVEIFAFSRWLRDRGQHLELPLRKLGLIVPEDSELPNAVSERERLRRLFPDARDLPRSTNELLSTLAAAEYDALHFTGHELADSDDPNRGGILLDNEDLLRPGDLDDEARNLGRLRPWIFINACHSARGLFALSGLGGFADAFLRAGAGSFLGAYWQVPDESAESFALAVYTNFIEDLALGEAVRRARVWFKEEYPGDPSFLAYALYGHPLAVRNEAASHRSADESSPPPNRQPESITLQEQSPSTPAPVQQRPTRPPRRMPERPSSNRSTRKFKKPSHPQPQVTEQRAIEPPSSSTARRHRKSGILFVHVPGGRYVLGADDQGGHSSPAHEVQLSPYWIALCPVTNAQYRRFLDDNTGHCEPPFWNDSCFNASDQPVVGVSWNDAQAFCKWASLALPTEAQWEAAARGSEGRRYPWGNLSPSPDFACYAPVAKRPTAVKTLSPGAGPYGTLGQAGNVWEWCVDAWDSRAYLGRHLARDPVVQRTDTMRVVRGGSWMSPAEELLAAHRERAPAGTRLSNQGFRCVWPADESACY